MVFSKFVEPACFGFVVFGFPYRGSSRYRSGILAEPSFLSDWDWFSGCLKIGSKVKYIPYDLVGVEHGKVSHGLGDFF